MKRTIIERPMYNYSVINKGTGATEIIKNVWFTFYHDFICDLYTSESNYISFALADYEIVKRA